MADAAKNTTPMHETPEFKAAVAEAAKAEVAKAFEEIKAQAGLGAEMKGMFSELIGQFQEANEQGRPKTKVPPEEMRRREAATQRAWELIAAARKRGDQPEYKLIAPVYLNERLVQPFTRAEKGGKVIQREITWTGMPSLAMLPVNKTAEAIYAAFKESLGASIKLGRIVGPHGGATATDEREWIMSPAGHAIKGEMTVKGEPDRRQTATASQHAFPDALGEAGTGHDNNDPNAPFVHVLGTVAQPLRRGENAPRQ